METDATYRGKVYPWQCDHVGHMNEIRNIALGHLSPAETVPA
jgi:hypothetical protein